MMGRLLVGLGCVVVVVVASALVRADCTPPGDTWRLELVSLEALDGVGDAVAERGRLGESSLLSGGYIDRSNPKLPGYVTISGETVPTDAQPGPERWSVSLTGAEP